MKKLSFVALLVALCLCLIACGETSESSKLEPLDSYIKEITEIVEDDIAYYSVIVDNSFNWDKALFKDQADLALLAIEMCREKMEQDGYKDFDVIGFKEDNYNAFYWTKPNAIKIYIGGKHTDTYLKGR